MKINAISLPIKHNNEATFRAELSINARLDVSILDSRGHFCKDVKPDLFEFIMMVYLFQ